MGSDDDPDTDGRGGPSILLPLIIIGIGLYLGGFTAIVFDELVFRTFVIHQNLPEWALGLVQTIYSPLILLVRLF